jgi:hypothetical protein
MERQRFDDSWKEAFEDAEMSPSENLWTNIELDLEKAEGKKMKKRILYFKLLAAASVAFAMTFAGVGVLYMNNQQDKLVANNNAGETASKKDQHIAANNASDTNSATSADDKALSKEKDSSTQLTVTEDEDSPSKTATPNPSTQDIAHENNATQAKATDQSATNLSRKNDLRSDKQLAANAAKNHHDSNRDQNLKLETGNDQYQVADNSNRTSNNQQKSSTDAKNADRIFDSSNSAVAMNKNQSESQVTTSTVTPAPTAIAEEERMVANAKLPEIVHVRKPAYKAEESQVDPVKAMLDRLAAEEQKYASNKKSSKEDKKSKKGNEKFWTSLGVAAGSYNTVVNGQGSGSAAMYEQYNSTSPQTTGSFSDEGRNALSSNIVRDQSHASGTSYAVAISLGGKISQRWVLQGGVGYMTQASDYVTTGLVSSDKSLNLKAGSITELNAEENDKVITSAEYNVNSASRFINVPLQGGYLIVDRDFGVQLNAGISTDLFLQNTVTPENGVVREVRNGGKPTYYQLEATTQKAGDESPYRTLNFSGLLSTELSYRFGEHYRIAVNPGIRYPFSSIYKSEIAVDAMPLTFDVGLKFRYIFN